MMDQFEVEKCLHGASTDNLVFLTINNSPDFGAIQMHGICPGTRGESKKLRGYSGMGMLVLGTG